MLILVHSERAIHMLTRLIGIYCLLIVIYERLPFLVIDALLGGLHVF